MLEKHSAHAQQLPEPQPCLDGPPCLEPQPCLEALEEEAQFDAARGGGARFESRALASASVSVGAGHALTARSGADKIAHQVERRVVMVVDDDDAIREALEDVLSDEGYDVIGASDGQQALDYLHGEKRPSAILVDLWMPVMDGWKFLDALLADPRLSRIPLVVLTAARDQRALHLCVAEVLTKPVQLHQVLGVLERLTKVSSC